MTATAEPVPQPTPNDEENFFGTYEASAWPSRITAMWNTVAASLWRLRHPQHTGHAATAESCLRACLPARTKGCSTRWISMWWIWR